MVAVSLKNDSVSIEHYTGVVHNLEVDDANSYVLESGTVHNCLPRDLQAFNRCLIEAEAEFSFRDFPLSAAAVNDETVGSVEDLITDIAEEPFPVVAVLGLAYKPNTAVTESSLGMALMTRFVGDAIGHDPAARPDVRLASTPADAVGLADVVVVATAHPEYATVDYQGKPVIDVWGIVPDGPNVRRLGRWRSVTE